jgi:NADH dehydrogenase
MTTATNATTGRPRVLIVGGGFGGIHAARALARAPVRVTLVDRNNHLVFQPLLYQVATAALDPPDIGYPLRSLLRRQRNAEVLMSEVQSIDPAVRIARLSSGRTLGYDYLIFAPGAQPFYFGHPEFSDHAPPLKSLRDALEMRYRVLIAFERAEQEPDPDAQRALLTFVIVGGGATGVELAGAIAELARHSLKRDFRHIDPTRTRVVLLEGGPHLLPTYPADLQAKAAEQLASLGIEVQTSTVVRAVDAFGVTAGARRIDARTVLWAAGVVGTPLARTIGVPVDRHGRIPVGPTLNPPGLATVFVVGDAAALTQDGKPVPGVAPAAIQSGRYAALAIIQQLHGRPMEPFRYWNKGELATIGRSKAVAMLPGLKLSGFIAWLVYMSVHLLYLSGVGTRVRVFLSWAWSYLTWSRGSRLIPNAQEAETMRRPPAQAGIETALANVEPPPAPPPH